MDRAEASRIAHGEFRLWNPLSEKARRARQRMTMPGGRETLGFALVLIRPGLSHPEPQPARSRIA